MRKGDNNGVGLFFVACFIWQKYRSFVDKCSNSIIMARMDTSKRQTLLKRNV